MPEQTFLVAFDALDPRLEPRAIKDAFGKREQYAHWWNHLPGIFLVTSALDETVIAEQLRGIAGGVSFLVIAVQPDRSEGLLPEQGWEWILRREQEHRSLSSTGDD